MNAVNEYARLLLKLHRMWLAHEDSSIEADNLRDEMDILWRKLSEDETKEVRNYAAELNQFTEEITNQVASATSGQENSQESMEDTVLRLICSSSQPLTSKEIAERIDRYSSTREQIRDAMVRMRTRLEKIQQQLQ